MKFITKLILLSAFSISSAHAIVVYDESINGDITGFRGSTTTNIGILQAGDNTIIGNLSGGVAGNPSDGTDEFDVFFFSTTDPWSFDALSISGVSIRTLLYDDIVFPFDSSIDSQVLSVSTNNIFGERTAGDWGISLIPGTNSGNVDYQFNINVSQVPIPAAIWLFASGLGILRLNRKIKVKL